LTTKLEDHRGQVNELAKDVADNKNSLEHVEIMQEQYAWQVTGVLKSEKQYHEQQVELTRRADEKGKQFDDLDCRSEYYNRQFLNLEEEITALRQRMTVN
jgi:chromosome segregation ATPase